MAWSRRPPFSSLSASCLILTEQPPLGPVKGPSVDLGGPHPPDRLPVILARVSHVVGQAVTGITLVPYPHHSVPGHLRDDGRGRDRVAAGVALDDRSLDDAEAGHVERVHQQEVGSVRQRGHRPLHGQIGGAQDVEAVDLPRIHAAHRPRARGQPDAVGQSLALPLREALRVVDPGGVETVPEDHRPRHHRAAERTPSHLVASRHALASLGAGLLLERP